MALPMLEEVRTHERKTDSTTPPRMLAPPRLSATRRQEIVDAYQSGMSKNEVARKFNVHRHTVDECLAGAHVASRPRGVSRDDQEQVARLYREGWSIARLAARFGCSDTAVATALRATNTRSRPQRGGRRPSRMPTA